MKCNLVIGIRQKEISGCNLNLCCLTRQVVFNIYFFNAWCVIFVTDVMLAFHNILYCKNCLIGSHENFMLLEINEIDTFLLHN